MSASDKKKLRKEEREAALTERQRKEKKESKKLKIYSIVFTVVMICIFLVSLVALGLNVDREYGLSQKWTTALTIGKDKLNCVEMNYYYRYAVNMFLQNSGGSVDTAQALFGVDLTGALDEQQYYDEDRTWADYFKEQAIDLALSDYALAEEANAKGFTIPADDLETLNDEFAYIESSAASNGYPAVDDYIRAVYGSGADYTSYKEFVNRNALAAAYRMHYAETLEVPADKISAFDGEHFNDYSSFTYNYYTLTYSSFLTGGTENEETGEITYTDEQHKASEEAAKAAAETLSKATTVEELNAAIANLEINKGAQTPPASTAANNVLYASVDAEYQEWIASKDRKAGDTYIADRVTTSYDEEDNETKTKSGYVVVLFLERNDNNDKLDNVRHILVHVGDDEVSGETATDATSFETAKAEAEKIYKEWKDGKADEASFIELVNKYTDDIESVDGLYENVSRYDNIFNGFFTAEARNWAVDPERKVGDTEIVESEAGYHIMYYVGEAEESYRQHSIKIELQNRYAEEWYNTMIANAKESSKVGNWGPIDQSSPIYQKTEETAE